VREAVLNAHRIVVKVGSSSISGENAGNIHLIVDALAHAFARGTEVVLVTSGAIATALPILGLTGRPDDLPGQQAAAAVGQNMLMNRYQESLNRHDIVAAQVLLTAGDLDHPSNRQNAQLALDRLLGMRMFPIINENDTVATAEIRFGDNDRLAALVAELVGADLLVLLSDVDALYTKPPHHEGAQRIEFVTAGDDLSGVEIGDIGAAGVGTGGASTKIAAAKYATAEGIPVILTATPLIAEALDGAEVGTWFEPAER
jgi:glutamate 5-kinase